MKSLSTVYRSQAITAQSKIEIGKAITTPRAKPRFRQLPADISDGASLILIDMLTMVRSLVLLDRRGYTFRTRDEAIRLPESRRSVSFSGRNALHPKLGVVADLLALVFFAISGDRARQREAYNVIALGHVGKRVRQSAWVRRLAIFLVAIGGSRVAYAQDERVTTPTELFEPESGDGVRLGHSFILRPEAKAEVIHDTNIYDLDQGSAADTLVSFRPTLRLTSDFPRHRVELLATGDIRRYAKYTGENSETGELSLKGLAELGGWINVEPTLSIARGVEQRGTAGDQFLTDTPIVFTRKEAALSISRVQHSLSVTLNGRLSKVRYDDTTAGGIVIDLEDRNFSTSDGSVRFDLRVGERLSLLTEFSANRLSYETAIARQRNSTGFAALGGARYEISSLVDIEAAVGYLRQNFDGGPYKPVAALNYRLAATWTPRPTWLVKAGVERSIDASPLGDAPAIFRTSYKLTAQHALSNRLLASGTVTYQREAYQSIDRTDRRFEVNAAAQYRLTPRVGLIASAGYRNQDGGDLGRSYHGMMASVAVRVVV
jgi:polysaccharide biosynthesis protein VpsM